MIGASSESGDTFGLNPYSIWVPNGYVSGSLLAGTDTFDDNTLQGMKLTPGVISAPIDEEYPSVGTVTFIIGVPEPSTWALLGVGSGWLGLTLWRRRLALSS